MVELLLVDETLWVWHEPINLHIYDFDFRQWFPCRCPRERNGDVLAIARRGPLSYPEDYFDQLRDGVRLLHSPDEYQRASDLSGWYPLLQDLTPRSVVFSSTPAADEIASEFRFPVFVKGTRQTSRHQQNLSIIRSPRDWDRVQATYESDSILRWQKIVVRELVLLRLVEESSGDRVPRAFEFRTFWWKQQLVGEGHYWWEGKRYHWTTSERREGLAIAEEAARRLCVPFLVVDVAMTAAGKWIVIECNDGQESGYAGIAPIGLWQRILDIERGKG